MHSRTLDQTPDLNTSVYHLKHITLNLAQCASECGFVLLTFETRLNIQLLPLLSIRGRGVSAAKGLPSNFG